MKYLVIIYGNKELWESFSPEEFEPAIAAQDAFNRKYFDSGELLGAYGLGDELTAKTISVRDGLPAVTDGPYIEAKEYLGSFYVVDCDSLERAVEIAAEMPSARFTDIEIRPLLHEGTPDV